MEKEFKERVKSLKSEFKGKNKDLQTLILFKKMVELQLKNTSEYEGEEELLALLKATNYNHDIIKSLLPYFRYNDYNYMKEAYSKSVTRLNNVLENYKNLAEELNIHSTLDLSNLFTYMLWNGYYSVSKTHEYDMDRRLLLLDLHSFDVIKGSGVCLGYSELLDNYLKTCGKLSSILIVYFKYGKEKIKPDYLPDMDAKKGDISLDDTKDIKVELLEKYIRLKYRHKYLHNHAVVLAEDEKNSFIYDPTNMFVLKVDDYQTGTMIHGKGNMELKPFCIFAGTAKPSSLKINEKMFDNDLKPALTKEEVIFSFENTLEIIKNNKNLLDDAYDNIHPDLEFIDKETNELGNNPRKLRKLVIEKKFANLSNNNKRL